MKHNMYIKKYNIQSLLVHKAKSMTQHSIPERSIKTPNHDAQTPDDAQTLHFLNLKYN
jgi:hypothetical protein